MSYFQPPYFGASYYPESWPREQIEEDLDKLLAHGLNTVRVAEFAWSTMEPEEGKYDLSLFREVVDRCRERKISIVMCTPSAAPPAWMTHKHPQIFADIDGVKMSHGGRRNNCPSNKTYRRYIANIVEVMAREFAKDENVIGWQVDNEIETMHKNVGCTCSDCRKAFQEYLKNRYETIDALNDAWGAYTWSTNFSSFEEINTMNLAVRQPPAFKYAWEQHKNELYADFCNMQAEIIRRYSDKPVGTNMMPTMQFDLYRANQTMDVAQFNHYMGPANGQFWYDAYRTQSKRPFWITETSPSWDGSCTPTGPRKKGFCRANTLATYALGSEMTLYWLFRSHRGGYEMGHGSVIDAWGRDTHISPEIRELAKDLDKLTPALRGTTYQKSGLAVVFANLPYSMAKYAPMTTRKKDVDYTEDIEKNIYLPLLHQQIRPDVITPDADLTPYRMIISHRQYTLEENGFADRILPWVEAGGTWVVGPLSDIFTKDLAKYPHAPFGHLEDLADIRRDYYIPTPNNDIAIGSGNLSDLVFENGKRAKTMALTYDALVAGENARVLARYAENSDDYLRGYAAITETPYGKGRIIVLGAQLDRDSYSNMMLTLSAECGIIPLADADPNIATAMLSGEYGDVLTAIETSAESGSLTLPFAAIDLLSEETFAEGQRITITPYRCLFLKKI